jgi:hypothetical protein
MSLIIDFSMILPEFTTLINNSKIPEEITNIAFHPSPNRTTSSFQNSTVKSFHLSGGASLCSYVCTAKAILLVLPYAESF